MRRLLLLLVVVGLLAAAFYYLGRPRPAGMGEVPAALGEVKETLGNVGDRLREGKTSGSVKAALELHRDLQPYSFDIDAQTGGAVVLKGEVPSHDLKDLAGKVAAAVPDVTRVDNQVRVNPQVAVPAGGSDRTMGENLDDKAIQAKVNLAFSLNRDLKGTDLKVSAFRRAVTLSGQVATPSQRQLAVAVAQQTTGVQGVTDQIAVSGQASAPAAADQGTRARAAEAALRASASLAPYALTVAAEGGGLILRGQVKTAAEKDLAGLLARDAAGTTVENQIQIASRPTDTL